MANIYASILTGTMDAFASVISNNLSFIMRRLTVISIAFMFPTFLVGYYGMNITLPFAKNPMMMYFIMIIALVTSIGSVLLLSDRRKRQVKKKMRELKGKKRKKIRPVKGRTSDN
jgi:magnesium transporter